MAGEYWDGLFKGTNSELLAKTLKYISYEHIFNHESILRLEVATDNILSFLLNKNTINNNCFCIKRIRFIYPKVNDKEALLLLLEAKKNANPGMKVMEPLYIYDIDGECTKEVKEAFNLKK